MSQMFKIAIHFHCGRPEQETVVNSFSLLLKTAIVNKNGPLYLVFLQHQYMIWLSKGMIQIMTYIPLSHCIILWKLQVKVE